MILTGYKAKFRDSGKFTLGEFEATDQVAPGDLKNEAEEGITKQGKMLENGFIRLKRGVGPKRPLRLWMPLTNALRRETQEFKNCW